MGKLRVTIRNIGLFCLRELGQKGGDAMFYSKRNTSKKSPSRRFRPFLKALEGRCVPATFTVGNLDEFGAGSFRQAILDANLQPGPDVIDFNVAGTVTLTQDLPQITDTVAINAVSSGVPSFGIDASGNAGMVFSAGSKGSSMAGLAVYGALGSGVVLNDSQIHLYSNYIGLALNGSVAGINTEDGIQINSTSHENVIGNIDPLQSINYYDTTGVSVPVSGWQGIRGGDTEGEYLIAGTSESNGLLYVGPINCLGGTSYLVNYPGAATTSVYGPDNVGDGSVQLVGSYRTGEGTVMGFIYQGAIADLSNPAGYRTLSYPGATFNYIHSVMGNLAVGNADGPDGDYPIGPGQAILYDTQTGQPIGNIVYPGSLGNTAYAIWDNGQGKYTIAGGFTLPGEGADGLAHGYLVDYNYYTGEYSHWKQYDSPRAVPGKDFITHFEALSSVETGVYTLSGDSVEVGVAGSEQGSWVTVRREADGSFGEAIWVDINYNVVDPTTLITSSDSVFGNQIVAIAINSTGVTSFQATLNFDFQLSNVISGNGGNGIGIYGANDNHIAMNYIGTDVTGNIDLGNGQNGIMVTAGAMGNVIGGQATGGNDPTGDVFVRPPMGNLISGNTLNGVLINDGATENLLSGNYIGTDATGNLAVGNTLDGVAIENANKNNLIGCTLNQDPFVFYNVISGNGGNGLRIKNSNDIIVHANFLGAGANNAVTVPNRLNGLLVEGTSTDTQVGGVIPLGNVIAGNTQNGMEIRDQVTGFVSFNSFTGLFAFGGPAPNGEDGILITSTGGGNLIRTCVVSGNLGNGIHITGEATGVTIDPNIVGLNTDGTNLMPNGRNGILIDGNAHSNTIGGTRQSVIPQNTVSGNNLAGISFQGTAHNNIVFNTVIGLDSTRTFPMVNNGAAIILGPGSYENVVGGSDPSYPNLFGTSVDGGIEITESNGNIIRNNNIGKMFLRSFGNGITINNGSNNMIGQVGGSNTITGMDDYGIEIQSGSQNSILNNSIFGNGLTGIALLPGANNNQVAPILDAAYLSNPSTLTIRGKIKADPNKTYLIQIFGNTGYYRSKEGENLIGSLQTTTDSTGFGQFTLTQKFIPGNGSVFTATATDPVGNTSEFSNPIVLAESKIYAVGADAGGAPLINVYNALTNRFVRSIMAYDAGFTGGVRVALGDLTGDGIPEIIASPGPGGGPNIRVFDSLTGRMLPGPLGSFMAFSSGFAGGVFPAVGDVNADGQAEIICGAGAGGGPNVRVFDGSNASLVRSFYAFDAGFTGGVSVACLDVGFDSAMDIICGAGAGGGPNVRIYEGMTNTLLRSFYAFDPAFTGGVFVAAGDVDGNGFCNVIIGAGAGGGPEVVVFGGENEDYAKIGSFNAYDPGFTGGVRVGTVSTGQSRKVNIVTGPGQGGGPEVRIFDGTNYQNLDDFFAFDQDFLGGIFVGGFEPFYQSIR